MQTPSLSATLPRSSSPLNRESLTEQTARAIREAILEGTYSLGQKLREAELAARFEVSSSVIREALHTLQGEGLIVTKPYCGRSVFQLRPEEKSELAVIRASLESYAAFLAAKKITPLVAHGIHRAAERFVTSPPANYSDWVDRELGFHRAVWLASANEWLLRQLNQCSLPIFAAGIVASRASDQDVQGLWRDALEREASDDERSHRALACTIAEGDCGKARHMMFGHILHNQNTVDRSLFPL